MNYKQMKKLLSLLFSIIISIPLYSQKSYVTVMGNTNQGHIILSGDIPQNMKNQYYDYELANLTGSTFYNIGYNIGYILNLLAQEGFTIEHQSTASASNNSGTVYTTILYTLSRQISSSNAVPRVQDNEGIYEVARYNLQGSPVSENEKGIQIIVYSNYTTTTVIME